MILITRPFNDSKAMAKALKKNGQPSFVEPLLRITYRDVDLDAYQETKLQSFITTSKYAKLLVRSDEPLASIPENGDNAAALLEWIEQNLQPDAGKLVYLRGEKITTDLTSALRAKGFDTDEHIVYRTEKPVEFTERLIRNWSKITGVTFFSKQTLSNFLALRNKHKLGLENIDAFCLSAEIEKSASGAGFKKIYVSDKANANSMTQKINEIYK